MNSKMLLILVVALASSGLLTSANADYYLDTLFPLGLVGINGTNAPLNYPPYGGQGWTWDQNEMQEKQLIFDLGINCIGAQDAKPDYLTKVYKRTIDKNVTSNILFLNH